MIKNAKVSSVSQSVSKQTTVWQLWYHQHTQQPTPPIFIGLTRSLNLKFWNIQLLKNITLYFNYFYK
jgi:hypothetical protein